jgi:hypothetical protein
LLGSRLESTTWHLITPDELDTLRDQQSDATVVAGTLSHYHYRFISTGQLEMRWLACPCRHCFKGEWDQCLNQRWVGKFKPATMRQLDSRGVAAVVAKRKELCNKIADSLSIGDVVALHCSEDTRGHRFWLARVVQHPDFECVAPVLTSQSNCPSSEEKFDAGERVVRIFYYDRAGASEDLFRLREDLGIHQVAVSTLRGGGGCFPISLSEHNTRSRRQAISRENKMWELSVESADAILNRIIHTFQDRN